MRQQSGTSPRRKAKGADDRVWINAMAAIVALMVAVMIYRAWQDRRPTAVTYGLNLIPAEQSGGQAILPLAAAPALYADGGVAGIHAGSLKAFVVRLADNDFRVWAVTSAQGRRVRYDAVAGVFVAQKNTAISYGRTTGTQINGDDRLPRYLCNLSDERLEIQLISQ